MLYNFNVLCFWELHTNLLAPFAFAVDKKVSENLGEKMTCFVIRLEYLANYLQKKTYAVNEAVN